METVTDTTEVADWRQFAPPPKSHIGAGLSVFCEDDCTVTAREVGGWPGHFVAHFGDLITVHGSLDTLARLAAEMTAAVDALRPPTLDQFIAGCVSDVVEGTA